MRFELIVSFGKTRENVIVRPEINNLKDDVNKKTTFSFIFDTLDQTI